MSQPVAGRVAGLALVSRELRVMSRAIGRVVHLLRRIVVPSRPCRSIISRHSQLPSLLLSRYNRLYRDTPTSQTARLSRYKDCIVTQPPMASPSLLSRYKTVYHDTIHKPGRARAAGLVVACIVAPPVVSWQTKRPPAAHLGLSPRPCLSQYNLLYYDST